MPNHAKSRDLRELFSVAGNLRHLADHTQDLDDQALYLTAAEALEDRARTLATALPHARRHEPSCTIRLHQSVDMFA